MIGLVLCLNEVNRLRKERREMMRRYLNELAGEAMYYIAMIILIVAAYVEEAYSWLRYGRPASNSLHDVD